MINFSNFFGHWSVSASLERDMSEVDVVVAHEFGDQVNPSLTTEDIINVAAGVCEQYGVSLICQHPGDVLAEEEGIVPYYVVRKHLFRPDEYLDTDEVNRQAASVCKQMGWKTVAIVAHPHHIWRAGKNLEKHGVRVLYADVSRVWYDRQCERLWLRTPWLFIPREIWSRFMYWRKGLL